jgi:type II secretory pathway predicted ATPase ExeA
VFIGLQLAAFTAEMNKALSAADAVISVTAPVGGGKSTAVRHALESMDDDIHTVSVGRLLRQADEILESLLEQLGADKVPPGTVQRVSLLREKLADRDQNEVRTVFVVEDAMCAGAETLCQLEALTAADTGICSGAAIVVMGDSTLDEMLSSEQLTRLNQRIRLRYTLAPFTGHELLDYVAHRVQCAGAELEDIFEPDCETALHAVSRGLPRLLDRIADAAMTEAAEQGLEKGNAELIERVAAFAPGIPSEQNRTAMRRQSSHEDGAPMSDTEAASDEPANTGGTLQDIEQCSSQTDVAADGADESSVGPNDLAAANLPEWDREPTLAQLRPDIEALEQAMAVDRPAGEASAAQPAIPVLTETATQDPDEDTQEAIPEITLDREIQATIEEATEDIKRAEAEAVAKAAANAQAEKTIDLANTGERAPPRPVRADCF